MVPTTNSETPQSTQDQGSGGGEEPSKRRDGSSIAAVDVSVDDNSTFTDNSDFTQAAGEEQRFGEKGMQSGDALSGAERSGQSAPVLPSSQTGVQTEEAHNLDEQGVSLDVIVKTLDQRVIPFTVCANWSVSKLRNELKDIISICVNEQRIICSGRVLRDEGTLTSWGVVAGSTLHVLRNPAHPPSAASSAQLVSSEQPDPVVFDGVNPGGDLLSDMLGRADIGNMFFDDNAMFQNLREQNPEINQLLSDPQIIRQSMEILRNPNLLQEVMRTSDRALMNMEAVPGGFNALTRLYETIQEPMHEATMHAAGNMFNRSSSANSTWGNADLRTNSALETREMPNPWAPQTRQPREVSASRFPAPFPAGIFGDSVRGRNPMFPFIPPPPNPGAAQTRTQRDRPADANQLMRSGPSSANTFGNIATMRLSPAARQRPASAPRAGTAAGSQWHNRLDGGELGTSGLTANAPAAPLVPEGGAYLDGGSPYEEQLQTLATMGFSDRAASIRALERSSGCLNQAIDILLSEGLR